MECHHEHIVHKFRKNSYGKFVRCIDTYPACRVSVDRGGGTVGDRSSRGGASGSIVRSESGSR